MSRREELLRKNELIRSTREIPDSEVVDARQNHRPRSGQGSFAQRQRLEDRIKELEAMVEKTEGRVVSLGRIGPNPWQPRRIFDQDELKKLADSIANVGLMQPIVVRAVSNRDTGESSGIDDEETFYQIIAGERRYKAHQILGKESIKLYVIEASDADMAALALSENIHRADLTAYEIALAIKTAEEMFPSKTSLATSLGMNRTALYKYLSYFKLPAFVIDDLDVTPGLLGRDAADAIASYLTNAGEHAVQSLLNLWPRVKSGDLDQGKIVNMLEAALRNPAGSRRERDVKTLFVGKEKAGSITRDESLFLVKIRAAALTPEKEAELRSFIEKMFQ